MKLQRIYGGFRLIALIFGRKVIFEFVCVLSGMVPLYLVAYKDGKEIREHAGMFKAKRRLLVSLRIPECA